MNNVLEKFLPKSKVLFYLFVDPEKAFDRVPRDVVIEEITWLNNGC